MLERCYPKSKIAELLWVDRSTIYREIKRNGLNRLLDRRWYYLGGVAHRRYLKRRIRPLKLLRMQELRDYVHEKLRAGYSPWQIEGRLKRENAGKCLISHEIIYRYIYSDIGRRYPKELSIYQRPKEINLRKIFGHWEGDLMMFSRGIQGNLITLRERKARFMVAIKNDNKTARNCFGHDFHVKNVKKIHEIIDV